jgi:hypothetical protein
MTDYICDVDGTLMNVSKRSMYAQRTKRDTDKRMNWDNFLDPKIMLEYDTPNVDVCDTIKSLRLVYSEEGGNENRIIITSARNERHRHVTELQLKNAGIKYDAMYLRDDDDFRPDDIVKSDLLVKIITDGYYPTVAFDDRNQVVKKWRELGIKCYQVRDGDF